MLVLEKFKKIYHILNHDVYNEQTKDLTKILPTFKLANATLYFDKISPHLHIVGVPIIENLKCVIIFIVLFFEKYKDKWKICYNYIDRLK